jgi:magnesium chelatase family protein
VATVLARATTFTLLGIDGIRVSVEADIHTGLPAFTIVGLGDAAVQESRERVRAALVNSGFDFPLRRITVNLAPADLRKAGPAFDLALAAALLAASGQARSERLETHAICGELGLDGSVRRVRGAIAMADAASAAGCTGIVVPPESAREAALVDGLEVIPVGTVRELAGFLAGEGPAAAERLDPAEWLQIEPDVDEDFAQLRGHRALKRALEVAAAGGHNVLLMGPPGSGKSMAAKRLPSIMPPLDPDDALEVTRIHSVAGVLGAAPLVERRPFRAPHHSISSAGLVGGGRPPLPGEASLAHHGVLFLDELSEFARPALEALRQPLEESLVRVTRAQRTVCFPARFLLVAATNPCPCGYQGDSRRRCSCHPTVAARYRARLSGPLLDRIDMVLRVEQPRARDVMAEVEPEGSRTIRDRVLVARRVQKDRLRGSPAACNAQMTHSQLRRLANMEPAARAALHEAHERAGLTMRGHDRVLRVARTLADLDGSKRVRRRHVTQAVAYREPPPALDAAVAGALV